MRQPKFVFAAALIAVAMTALVFSQDAINETATAEMYLEQVFTAPYTEWAHEPNVPEGYYVGVEPHGMILRTFMNDVALEDTQGDATSFSDGAIIVKENHMPGDVDLSNLEPQDPVEAFDGNLASLTFMVKVEGFNPDAGDWFWVKTSAEESTFDAVGAAAGCIECHGQVADQDYVFNVAPGGN
jgi:hypothetical protein